jgi:hypothetical protein
VHRGVGDENVDSVGNRGTEGQAHADRSNRGLLTALRARTERAHALLGRWRALDRITLCPGRITVVMAAALVLTSMLRGR